MRPVLAAAATAALLLVGYFGAPLVPVALGAALTCAYYWWKVHGRRRAL
jgi:hypothetical protein